MTQLEKAREEILNWHIAHNSHPKEWTYYKREHTRKKFYDKHKYWASKLGA